MRQQGPFRRFVRRPPHLQEGFVSEQIVQQRPQQGRAAFVLRSADLFAVESPGRMDQFLQGLFHQVLRFRQTPEVLQPGGVGVVGQGRGPDEMTTDQNVGVDLLGGFLSGVFLPATRAARQRGHNRNDSKSFHSGGPLLAREGPV